MQKIIIALLFTGSIYGSAIQQEKLTDYLKTLVSMPTVTEDKEENSRALRWVESQLSPLKLHFKYHTFEGHTALVVTTKETKAPDIFLISHIDVVPAPKELFSPRIEGGKMFGRGVYDMKMAIACYLLLMHELQGEDLNIGLMLTSDEEIGGMNGVKRLLEAGYTAKVAFLPDGGFDWNFEEMAKGVLQVKITARGKSVHSSRPWLGENAIEILMGSLKEVQSYFEREKHGNYFATANVGTIAGGQGVNQVPDRAEARVDIRYPPEMKGKEIYAALVKLLQKVPNVTIEIIAEGSPHQVNQELPPFTKFKQIAKTMYGIDVGKTRSHGASDARFFGEKNIPVVVIAPKGGEIHSDGEWIDLEDLTRFYNVLKQWVMSEKGPV